MSPKLMILLLAQAIPFAAQGQAPRVDPATLDARRAGDTPGPPTEPRRGTITLQSGATVFATPAAEALQDYLQSDQPPGQRFRLGEIEFTEGGRVREDPNGSIATLVAILDAHPRARLRIEVERPSATDGPQDAAMRALAHNVTQAFVRNGLASARIDAPLSGQVDRDPIAFLVVTEK